MAIIISQMDLADGDVATDVFIDQQFQTYLDTAKQNKRAKKE